MRRTSCSPGAALAAVPRYIVGALLIVITLLVNVEVALRFVINLPLDAISEIVLLLFPWLTMLGAAVALTVEGTNVGLHLFSARVTPPLRKALRIVTCVGAASFGVFMIVEGLHYTQMTGSELSHVLQIPRAWETAVFPVSGLLFLIYSVRMLLPLRKGARDRAREAVIDPAP